MWPLKVVECSCALRSLRLLQWTASDQHQRTCCHHVRLVLAPTRWRFRKAVKAVNETLNVLCLEKHPDKTFIGRIERGFDFLGYHFGPDGLSVAKKIV